MLPAVQASARPDFSRYDSKALTNQIWNLLADCWTHQAKSRPAMSTVIWRMSVIDSGHNNSCHHIIQLAHTILIAYFEFEGVSAPSMPPALPPPTVEERKLLKVGEAHKP